MKRVDGLDVARFTAALMVVAFHYTFNGIVNGKIASLDPMPLVNAVTRYGYLGVEWFFLISGYVICFSAQGRSARAFALSRALRLYPAYWFAVLFTATVAWFWGGELMAVRPKQVLVNLTMLQSYVGVPHVDGVYWTLAYEWAFYALVWAVLWCGGQRVLPALFVGWPFLMALAYACGVAGWPFLGGYYAYFAAGAIFALLAQRPRQPLAIVSLLLAYGLCLVFTVGNAGLMTRNTGSAFSSGVIAALVTAFFATFAVLLVPAVRAWRLPGARLAGSLTYPIYLLHAHLGYMVISRFADRGNPWPVVGLTVGGLLLLAWAVHEGVEVRLRPAWERCFSVVA